jgi:hypothetical protein
MAKCPPLKRTRRRVLSLRVVGESRGLGPVVWTLSTLDKHACRRFPDAKELIARRTSYMIMHLLNVAVDFSLTRQASFLLPAANLINKLVVLYIVVF